MDLRREQDIEHLRRIAIAQQIQIEQLLRVLRAKCEELEALKATRPSCSRRWRWSRP